MPDRRHATVLIAGGSIAGLTLANALEQLGIDYLVLEKHKQIAPDVGASLCIFPNGFRVLDQLGCYERIKEMAQDADSFASVTMRDSTGRALVDVPDAARQIERRTGYVPLFLERRMLIQALYDNLQNKSTVFTGKSVVKVSTTSDRVHIVTSDGTVYTGALLVGADGIHSTVRQHMWNLTAGPPISPGADTRTTYCCIFGISPAAAGFPQNQTQHIQGSNHSYLISTGPKNAVYWFLFTKLDSAVRGLDSIPRYTDAERDALAARHAGDALSRTLTFGAVYSARTTATLQALPEVVFSHWHGRRLMTIGDAAHKVRLVDAVLWIWLTTQFNPIAGQGGNSAIEDAACLATHLHSLLTTYGHPKENAWSEDAVQSACAAMQRERFSRVSRLARKAHWMQRFQARDSWGMWVVAACMGGLVGGARIVDSLCSDSEGGVVVEGLRRPRGGESRNEASSRGWVRVLVVGCVVLALVLLGSGHELWMSVDLFRKCALMLDRSFC